MRTILKNNIYGVDLNEESVEITKLSLWLKSAEKDKKLTTLDANIKCGNSLVNESGVAGNKAFDWKEEFSDIFNEGGFHVVVGNPPYGAVMSDTEKEYLETQYETYEYQLNSYSLFYEKGIEVLREGGILGYITPATFTYQQYFSRLRTLIQKYTQISIEKYNYEVFADANIGDSVSWILQKTENRKTSVVVRICNSLRDQQTPVDLKEYADVVNDEGLYVLAKTSIQLKNDIEYKSLGDIANITAGIKPYQVGKGDPKQTREIVTNKIYTSDHKVDDSYINCIIGRDFHKYRLLQKPQMYLSYGKWLAEPREKAPFFNKEKIILRQTADSLIGFLDSEKRINLNNVYNVGIDNDDFDIRFVLGLLNSKLMNYFYQNISQEKGRAFAEVKKNYLEKLPIVKVTSSEQQELSKLVKEILSAHVELSGLDIRFQKLVCSESETITWSKGLDEWWTLDFSDFLSKIKAKLSLEKKDELLNLFDKYKSECVEIHNKTKEYEKTIDKTIFKFYKLSEDEIELIESQ